MTKEEKEQLNQWMVKVMGLLTEVKGSLQVVQANESSLWKRVKELESKVKEITHEHGRIYVPTEMG